MSADPASTSPPPTATPIAVWVEGHGPALVMVHGSIADHTTFDSFVAVLREHFTTYAMDRRGFGATPDADDYTIERRLRRRRRRGRRRGRPHRPAGRAVGPLLRGQLRDGRRRPHRQRQPPRPLRAEPRPVATRPDRSRRIEAALADGDNDAAIVAVLVDILEMTDEEIDAVRADPLWPVRLAAAPTVPGSAGSSRAGCTSRASSTRSPRRPCCSTGSDSVPDIDRGDATGRRARSPTRTSRSSTGTPTSPTRPTRRWSPPSSATSSPIEHDESFHWRRRFGAVARWVGRGSACTCEPAEDRRTVLHPAGVPSLPPAGGPTAAG